MATHQTILRIAVPSPLFQIFDYLAPDNVSGDELAAGMRVRVPFGRSRSIGVLLETAGTTTVAQDRLKTAEAVLDQEPVISKEILALAKWASAYYHHPIGEVLSAVLPVALRNDRSHQVSEYRWKLTAQGSELDPADLRRAPRQQAALQALREYPEGLTRKAIELGIGPVDSALRALRDKYLVERVECQAEVPTPVVATTSTQSLTQPGPELSEAQADAIEQVCGSVHQYGVYLLDGVTGSGKTEVYLRIAEKVLNAGRQVLVLVPEIGLTPQLVERFRQRLAASLVVLHSGLSDRERLQAWKMAGSGEAGIVLGTRSAVFTPLARPGLYIVDEEHDGSFKQQDGFRYSARDLLVWRARHADVPIILGSATPSLESLYNTQQGRYTELRLPSRVGGAKQPQIHVMDIRKQRMEDGLSEPLLAQVAKHLAAEGQVLLFLNRRGFAPVLLCHACGWSAQCRRCDARMVLHQASGHLRCHHCGAQRRVDDRCGDCGCEDLRPIGMGTERVGQALAKHFPEQTLVRIDRDSTRRKGSLEAMLEQVHSGEGNLLLGTQMLAKGHHFPNVTLVGILDADGGLYGTDFRASERMAQLIVQVAGRAGRAQRPGEVFIQTHHPDHPALQQLIKQGYNSFARTALKERAEAQLPPFSSLALLRAEATDRQAPWDFLTEAQGLAQTQKQMGTTSVECWGPVPAPMERRGGRYRAQLMLQAENRTDLQCLLRNLVPLLGTLKGARKVRWSIDVDPVDTL